MADFEKVYSISFRPQRAIADISKIEKRWKRFAKVISKSLRSKEITGAIAGLTKKLNRASKAFDRLGSSAQRNTRRISAGFNRARGSASRFNRVLADNRANNAALAGMAANLRRVERELARATRQMEMFRRNTRRPIEDATRNIDRLGRSGRRAADQIASGSRRAAGGLNLISGASARAGQGIKGLVAKIVLLIGAARGIRSIVGNFLDFDRAMTLAGAKFSALDKTMTPGTETFREYRKEIRAAAVDTEHSAASVARAVDFWAKAGKTAEQTKSVIPITLDFATANTDATGKALNVARAGDILSDVLGQFKLNTDDPTQLLLNTARASDVMTKAANSANVSAEEMFESFKTAGPILSSLGGDIEETSALIATMANAGLKGSIAGRAMRSSLLALNNPTSKQQKVLKKYNIDIKDTEGNMVSLTSIIGQLDKATAHLGTSERFKTFGTVLGSFGITGFLNLVAKGEADITGLTDSLRKAGGETKRLAKITATSARGQMQKFWNRISDIGFTLIEETKLFDKLGDAMAGIDWVAVGKTVNDDVVPALLNVATIIGDYVLPVLSILSNAINSVLYPALRFVGELFEKVSSSGKGFGDSLNAIIKTIPSITADGIKALSAEFISFIRLVTVFAINAEVMFASLSQGIIANWDEMKESMLDTSDVLGESYGALFKDLKEMFFEIVSIFLGGTDNIETDWDEMGTKLSASIGTFVTVVSEALSVIARVSATVFGVTLKIITTIIAGIKGVFGNAFSGILQILEGNFLDGIVRIGAAIFNAITLPIRSAMTGLIRMIQGIPGADDLAKKLGINLDDVSTFVKEGITVETEAKDIKRGASRAASDKFDRLERDGQQPGAIRGIDSESTFGQSIDTGIQVPDILSGQTVNTELQAELVRLNQNIDTIKPIGTSIEPVAIEPVGDKIPALGDSPMWLLVEGQKEQLKIQSVIASNTETFQKQMLDSQRNKSIMRTAPQVNVDVGPSNITINAPGVDAHEVSRMIRQNQSSQDRETAAIMRNAASSVMFGEQ